MDFKILSPCILLFITRRHVGPSSSRFSGTKREVLPNRFLVLEGGMVKGEGHYVAPVLN
jgi:hypothetical protein